MVRKILILLLIVFSENSCFAQKNNYKQEDCFYYYNEKYNKRIYINYTSGPISPDSILNGYVSFIYKHMRISFDDLIEQTSIRPKYKVIIDEKGKVIMCQPLFLNSKEKRTSNFTVLDREVIRIFHESPNWIPATCKEQNIAIETLVVLTMPHVK
jgi:hypothetical protein